jgi:hypothetical protein
MSQPTPDQQVQFLVQIQRLLQEGQFVATYKFALLMSLADISVEDGDDSGDSLQIPTNLIADKFIRYYWRHAVPFTPGNASSKFGILQQNTGKQAGIVRLLESARLKCGGSVLNLKRDAKEWKQLVREVEKIVCVMPLWKLQTVGGFKMDFIYDNVGRGRTVSLKPGVAFCMRKFHGIICDLVQSAWVNYVRRINSEILGTTADLHEFLFGSERNNLSVLVPVLIELQKAQCFYCAKKLNRGSVHVDHFIPWSRYPVDLGHNFVLADTGCNTSKGDRIAASEHLERWIERNSTYNSVLKVEFDGRGIIHDLPASLKIARWAYTQTKIAGGL